MPRFRNVDDAQLLRAMAHPLRIRLYGTLVKDGSATASELARRLGESSGATSYHLRILAKYGFIEDDSGRNRGRERWWRAADEGLEWSLDTDDRGLLEANRAFGQQLSVEYQRWLQRWHDEMPEWGRSWRAAASATDRFYELTPKELRGLADEVLAILDRYEDRRERRGDDTERVTVLFHAFPERRAAT